MTSKAGKQAPFLHGVPIVASTTERDALFPTPDTDQRVQIRSTGDEYTYSGSAWFLSKAGEKGGAGGLFNVIAYGASGSGSTDDYTAIAAAAAAADAVSGVLYFPPGYTYKTNSVIDLGANTSVWLPAGATVKAGAAIAAVFRTAVSTVSKNRAYFGNGIIDCNSLANIGLHLRYFAHTTASDLNIQNPLVYGLQAGDGGAAASSYELMARNVRVERTDGSQVPASSIGLYLSRASDSHLTDCIAIATETGFKCDTSGNNFTNCHAWSYQPTNGWMLTCFDDNGSANMWNACYADTPGATPAQLGGGTVPTAFRIRNQNSVLILPRVYNNALYGLDNQVVGIVFDNAAPFATILGPIFKGETASFRIKQDISATSQTSLTVLGAQYLNVATSSSSSRIQGTVTVNGDVVATREQIGGGAFITNYSSYTTTWDPPSVAAGAQTTTTISATGAALGNPCTVSFDKDLQGMQLSAYVSATNTITVVLQNGTAGAIDLASGTLRAGLWKP